jgi:hypothetical protein
MKVVGWSYRCDVVTQHEVLLLLLMGQQKLAAGIVLIGIVLAARTMLMDPEMKKAGVVRLQNPLILLRTWWVAKCGDTLLGSTSRGLKEVETRQG